MSAKEESTHSYRDKLDTLFKVNPYKEKLYQTIHKQGETNAGLWLDRYLTRQDTQDTKDQDNAKKSSNRSLLIEEVAALPIPETYTQFYARWLEMLKNSGVTHDHMRKAKVKGRMVIGLGDESVLETSIALHHTYGVPYIPGSALKGLAASYARQRLKAADWGKESEAYKIIFGDTKEAGYVTFFDALLHVDAGKPVPSVLRRDTITVHHPGYYQSKGPEAPSDWDSPTPIPLLSATGVYMIALTAPDLEHEQIWLRRVFKILRYALAEMGIGAKTSSGYGRMEFVGQEENEYPEEDEVAEVTPEPAWQSLMRDINAGQWNGNLFNRWKQLPPDEESTLHVALALLNLLENRRGKKRSDKDENRYRVLHEFIEQHQS